MPVTPGTSFNHGNITTSCNSKGGVITIPLVNTDDSTVIGIWVYDPLGNQVGAYTFPSGTSGGSISFEALVNGQHTIEVEGVVDGVPQKPNFYQRIISCKAPLALTADVTDATAYGAADGSVTLNASGGTVPYTYAIDSSAPQSSNVFNFLAPGSYTFRVFDNTGASVSKQVTVGQPVMTDGTFIKTQCFGFDLYEMVADGQGGLRQGDLLEAKSSQCDYIPPCDLVPQAPVVDGYSVQLAASTSFGPVEYSIDGGEFTQQSKFTGLTPGSYTVTYRDQNVLGCVEVNTFEIVPVVEGLHYSRNPFWHAVEAPLGSVVELELWIESAHYKRDYRFIVKQSKVATEEGMCHFRLDPVLSRLVKPEAPTGTITRFCSINILNYFVRYRVDAGEWKTSKDSTVLLGGMPLEQLGLSAYGHFLTSHQRVKKINPAHPEYLYWLCGSGRTSLKIRRGTRTVGVAAPAYVTEELTELKPNQLLCISAFGPLAGNVTGVDVTIVDDAGVPISETRTYQVDPHPAAEERCFLFHNSWGGFDTLRCTGYREAVADNKEEVAELDLQPGFQLHRQGQRFVFAQTASRKIKQSTGPNPEWRQEYLQDFVLSAARYEFLGAQLLPILVGKKALEESAREPRQGYVFEYEYAFDLTGYAKSY